ncbi:MAG: 4Fe-4S dicluster domain-containing protein [Phycisphaerae bacterium]|nr:4Fe-4S dicluster domain-containing protein [Phycisphaerae bacterium]
MAELIPASFADLVTRLHREPQVQNALFGLPTRKWYRPDEHGPDLSVTFHGRPAGTPVGPAAGPHTQMAQNLLLSYVAGGRILELKTVQANDRLTIPRPCIDMAGVGYNVEWSQELRIGQSVREYVAGVMLIEMFRHGPWGEGLAAAAGDVIYEASVGYDLQGIQSHKVCDFLEQMRSPKTVVERLRAQIPREFHTARELDFPHELATSLTLSTFHGCPPDEIERIGEFLLGDQGFDLCVKLNPPLLGRDRLEHLLHDIMGYHDIEVNPPAYESGLQFDEAVGLCRRLAGFAAARSRRFGVKFCNTLEVRNHRRIFGADCPVMYLSGQPLYVLTMALAHAFREAAGPDLPFSYSGGVDKDNFVDVVACEFVPVTVCTDLLRPGGYGRLPAYLRRLADSMREAGATDIPGFIRARADAQSLAHVATAAAASTRYRPERVCREPHRLNTPLKTFDCITCDKCIPVCPNAAIFTYPTTPETLAYRNVLVQPSGQWKLEEVERQFTIEQERQIAVFAGFCNECGNCGTFCPQQGAPYRDKPAFFGSLDSWRKAAPRDGFVIEARPSEHRIHGRVDARVYMVESLDSQTYSFHDGPVSVRLDAQTHQVLEIALRETLHETYPVDLAVYHTIVRLLTGVLDTRYVNQVNVTRHRHEPT